MFACNVSTCGGPKVILSLILDHPATSNPELLDTVKSSQLACSGCPCRCLLSLELWVGCHSCQVLVASAGFQGGDCDTWQGALITKPPLQITFEIFKHFKTIQTWLAWISPCRTSGSQTRKGLPSFCLMGAGIKGRCHRVWLKYMLSNLNCVHAQVWESEDNFAELAGSFPSRRF